MAVKNPLGVTLKNSDSIETWLVNTKAARVSDVDIGKAVTLDKTNGGMKLAAAGDAIDGFIQTVESETAGGGRSLGTVLRPGQGARSYVTASAALAVGDYITGAAQADAKTAETLYNYAKNGIGVNYNIPKVAKSTDATAWRVIDIANATDKIYLVEAL